MIRQPLINWAFELADRWGIPEPFKMLEEMRKDTPNYWVAFRNLKNPQYRENLRLELLKEEDPDKYYAEITAQQLAELEESRKQS
jgi:hypothetical protein